MRPANLKSVGYDAAIAVVWVFPNVHLVAFSDLFLISCCHTCVPSGTYDVRTCIAMVLLSQQLNQCPRAWTRLSENLNLHYYVFGGVGWCVFAKAVCRFVACGDSMLLAFQCVAKHRSCDGRCVCFSFVMRWWIWMDTS